MSWSALRSPNGSHRVRRFAVRLAALKGAAVAAAGGVLLLVGLAAFAWRAGFDRSEYERLREEARLHRQEMGQLAASEARPPRGIGSRAQRVPERQG